MQATTMLKNIGKAVALTALLAAGGNPVHAESVQFEYKLKAVFLLNFAKFVSWPASAFTAENAPLNICILGTDPFGPVLDQVVQGETVQSHPLAVVRPTPGTGSQPTCHIAYISPSLEAQYEKLLGKMATDTLTVGETDKFIDAGGMVNFVLEETKVKFVINSNALTNVSFVVSSKLLSLGRAARTP